MAFYLRDTRTFRQFLSWAVLFFFLLTAAPAFAFFGGKIESFSADQVMISPDGKEMGTSKLYITPEAQRMDGLPGGGPQGQMMNMTVISYKDQNRQYIYNHDKKLVFEANIDEAAMMKDLEAYKNVDDEQVLGKEKVSGYSCVKKQITTTSNMTGMKMTTTTIIWQSDKIDFPLRVKSEGGGAMELRNIDTGKPSKKLFAPITGYQKVDNMMAVMGMDLSAMMEEDDDVEDSSRQNIEDVDMDEMMANMEQIMGNNASPEEMAAMKQTMQQAFASVRQMDREAGAADGLWQIIPKHPGDVVGYELKAPNVYDVILGTNSSISDVCDYYNKKLPAKGWSGGGGHIENGQGFIHFSKGDDTLSIATAKDPGMDQKYKCYYNIQLTGPNF